MNDSYDILVAGVGGQGNLVCGRSLAHAALIQGKRPVLGDTFGASRRGGSVLSHLRIADVDLGPLIPQNQADLILGMEPIESLRTAITYASPQTRIVVSTSVVQSPATLSGAETYPEISKVIASLESLAGDVYQIDPKPHLERIGSDRVLNVLMLGFLVGLSFAPFSRDEIVQGIDSVVGMSDSNEQAFDLGFNEGQKISAE